MTNQPHATNDVDVPARVLAISAHPDDSELQAGGTLAKWAAAGSEISIVVCTDGSKGTWDPHADLSDLIATRQSEQREAAARLGATGTVGFCEWVDGELVHSRANVGVLAAWIRRLQPTIVLSHDPWKRYRLHPDHRAAGFLVTDAIVAARDPHFFPEHEHAYHRPDELWLFEADEPNHAESVNGWVDQKIQALEAHKSQLESTMHIDPNDEAHGRAAFAQLMQDTALAAGSLFDRGPSETFHRLTDL